MTEQHVSIWDDPAAEQSDDQDQQVSITTTETSTESNVQTSVSTSAENPIAGAIAASNWEREDIELAMSAAKLLLMAYFVLQYRRERAGGS